MSSISSGVNILLVTWIRDLKSNIKGIFLWYFTNYKILLHVTPTFRNLINNYNSANEIFIDFLILLIAPSRFISVFQEKRKKNQITTKTLITCLTLFSFIKSKNLRPRRGSECGPSSRLKSFWTVIIPAQCFLNSNVHINQLGMVLKCSSWTET